MKIVALSDTHGNHPSLPKGDVLVHAGDACDFGTDKEFRTFLNWFSKQPHEYKIYVPGNHDHPAELSTRYWKEEAEARGINMLVNDAVIIQGKVFYGCPHVNKFWDWAFMLQQEQLNDYWDSVMAMPDVLITHGPAYGILDAVGTANVGDTALRNFIFKTAPDLHICGHIHESAGYMNGHSTEFHNVACTVREINLK